MWTQSLCFRISKSMESQSWLPDSTFDNVRLRWPNLKLFDQPFKKRPQLFTKIFRSNLIFPISRNYPVFLLALVMTKFLFLLFFIFQIILSCYGFTEYSWLPRSVLFSSFLRRPQVIARASLSFALFSHEKKRREITHDLVYFTLPYRTYMVVNG